MKRNSTIVVLLAAFFCLNICFGYSEDESTSKDAQIKTSDVNKDGKPDVTYYYYGGEYVQSVVADTNFDGKPDVSMTIKDGKFDSAQVDTDYDGETDKEFRDSGQFNQWINENRPDFENRLNRDWQFDLIKF